MSEHPKFHGFRVHPDRQEALRHSLELLQTLRNDLAKLSAHVEAEMRSYVRMRLLPELIKVKKIEQDIRKEFDLLEEEMPKHYHKINEDLPRGERKDNVMREARSFIFGFCEAVIDGDGMANPKWSKEKLVEFCEQKLGIHKPMFNVSFNKLDIDSIISAKAPADTPENVYGVKIEPDDDFDTDFDTVDLDELAEGLAGLSAQELRDYLATIDDDVDADKRPDF